MERITRLELVPQPWKGRTLPTELYPQLNPAFDRPEQELVYSGWGRLNFFIPIILLPLSNDSAAASLHPDLGEYQGYHRFGSYTMPSMALECRIAACLPSSVCS